MKITLLDFWLFILKVLITIFSAIIILAIGFLIYQCIFAPTLQFKCRVYHIYGSSNIEYLIQKSYPFQPRWNRYDGWTSDFNDPTVCRFDILKVDTIKVDTIKK